MTKKHFVMLAKMLKRNMPFKGCHSGRGFRHTEACYQTCYDTWKLGVIDIADFCQSQNAQFDRALFLQACGIAPCCVTHAAHGGNCK